MIKVIEPYKGISQTYDEIRPSYPEELIEDLITKTKINKDAKLLEIGAGTGKATVQMAKEGFSIHAIEIGEDMAAIFREKCSYYPKVSLEVVPFEEWENGESCSYDMIYSAQAFHWLDVNVKYTKCHRLLKEDGYLALFWYNTCDTNSEKERKIQESIDNVIHKYYSVPSIKQSAKEEKKQRKQHTGVSQEDERIKEIEDSGLFKIIEKLEYKYEVINNAKQCIKAIKSVPAYATLLDNLNENKIQQMDRELEDIIKSHGGSTTTLFNFSLYLTKKV